MSGSIGQIPPWPIDKPFTDRDLRHSGRRLSAIVAPLAVCGSGVVAPPAPFAFGPDLSGIDEFFEDPAEGPEPKIIIEKFAFTNSRTSLDSDVLGETSVEIPDIHLTGIGEKSQGVTIQEALKQLLSPIVRASTEALARENLNLDEMKEKAEERLDEELKERVGTDLEGVKGLLNR